VRVPSALTLYVSSAKAVIFANHGFAKRARLEYFDHDSVRRAEGRDDYLFGSPRQSWRLQAGEDAGSPRTTAEVTISAGLLKRYKENLNAYCGKLRDFCVRRGMMHLTLDTSTNMHALLLDYLRKRGLLK
jgi:hypothetical protein